MVNTKYVHEYIHEESINCELICSICSKLSTQPISTSCDDTFYYEYVKHSGGASGGGGLGGGTPLLLSKN